MTAPVFHARRAVALRLVAAAALLAVAAVLVALVLVALVWAAGEGGWVRPLVALTVACPLLAYLYRTGDL